MRIWPDTLPAALRQPYGFRPAEQTRRTQMEVGPQRVRRITRARHEIVDVSWRMTTGELEAFKAWFLDDPVSLAGASNDVSAWVQVRMSVIPDAVVGPGGVLADQLVEAAASGDVRIGRILDAGLATGGEALIRATLKDNGRRWSRLGFINADTQFCHCVTDLQTGTFAGSGNLISREIEDRGDGWWRITMIAPVGTGANPPAMRIAFMESETVVTYTGDGVSGQYACEVQAHTTNHGNEYVPSDSRGRALGASAGASWTLIPLSFGGSLETVEARFKSPFEARHLSGLNWEVSAQLEVRGA